MTHPHLVRQGEREELSIKTWQSWRELAACAVLRGGKFEAGAGRHGRELRHVLIPTVNAPPKV